MRRKQKAKLVVKLLYDYGDGYERNPAGGRIMNIEGVTPEEIGQVESVFSALDWGELEDLEAFAAMVLSRRGLRVKARHEGGRR